MKKNCILETIKRDMMNESSWYYNTEPIYENMFEDSERVEIGANDVVDKVSQIRQAWFFSFSYVHAADFYKTKKSWRSDDVAQAMKDTGYENQELSDFNKPDTTMKKNPIKGIITITSYANVNFNNAEGFNKGYGQRYADKKQDLNLKYGLDIMHGDSHMTDKENDSAPGFFTGIDNTETGTGQDHSHQIYMKLNMAHAKGESASYIIDENGNIVEEIPTKVLFAMSKQSKPAPNQAYEALDPEQLESYLAELKAIDDEFKTRKFDLDKVIYLVGSTQDHERFYYKNPNAAIKVSSKSEVRVPIDQIMAKAKERTEKVIENADDKMLQESFGEERSLTHGTLHPQHVSSALLNFLKNEHPEVYSEFIAKHPNMEKAIENENDPYWESEEGSYDLNDDLYNTMDGIAPEGEYFGSHPGDGSDIGFWKNEEDEDVINEAVKRTIKKYVR